MGRSAGREDGKRREGRVHREVERERGFRAVCKKERKEEGRDEGGRWS